MQACDSDKSVSEPGKDAARSENYQNAARMVNLRELLQKPSATVSEGERQLMQATPNKEATTQELQRDREFRSEVGELLQLKSKRKENHWFKVLLLE